MKQDIADYTRGAAVVLAVALTASLVWAKAFDDPSAGAPPIGIIEDEFASGSKLNGPVYVKVGGTGDPLFPVELVVRVQRGSGLWIFHGLSDSTGASEPKANGTPSSFIWRHA